MGVTWPVSSEPRPVALYWTQVAARELRAVVTTESGTAWWFNDQIDGMRAQMAALSNSGVISADRTKRLGRDFKLASLGVGLQLQ